MSNLKLVKYFKKACLINLFSVCLFAWNIRKSGVKSDWVVQKLSQYFGHIIFRLYIIIRALSSKYLEIIKYLKKTELILITFFPHYTATLFRNKISQKIFNNDTGAKLFIRMSKRVKLREPLVNIKYYIRTLLYIIKWQVLEDSIILTWTIETKI